ncbi:MAG: hypothetical protein WCV84_03970, partial [Patescibacteria group bacterium]
TGYKRWEWLLSGKAPCYRGQPVERLRLLSGNCTHVPVVEWVLVNLHSDPEHASIARAQDSSGLADELLVLVWLFPFLIPAINSDDTPNLIAAGYEVNVPERGGGDTWPYTVVVSSESGGRNVTIGACHRTKGGETLLVPSLCTFPRQ